MPMLCHVPLKNRLIFMLRLMRADREGGQACCRPGSWRADSQLSIWLQVALKAAQLSLGVNLPPPPLTFKLPFKPLYSGCFPPLGFRTNTYKSLSTTTEGNPSAGQSVSQIDMEALSSSALNVLACTCLFHCLTVSIMSQFTAFKS